VIRRLPRTRRGRSAALVWSMGVCEQIRRWTGPSIASRRAAPERMISEPAPVSRLDICLAVPVNMTVTPTAIASRQGKQSDHP
jgi:hypothetical protein